MWREYQWKQVETMVALATLSLQIAKKLFQKGNLENKIWCVILLSGADVHTQSFGIDPSFRINLCKNPAFNWPSFVRQSGIMKWLTQTYRTLVYVETPVNLCIPKYNTCNVLTSSYSKKTVMVDCYLSLRAVSILMGQRALQMCKVCDIIVGRNL